MREFIESYASNSKLEHAFAFNHGLTRAVFTWKDFLYDAFLTYVKFYNPRAYGPTLAAFDRWYETTYNPAVGSESSLWEADEREQA